LLSYAHPDAAEIRFVAALTGGIPRGWIMRISGIMRRSCGGF
jgi:hypothetical protein